MNVSVQISAALGLAVLDTIAAGQTGRLSDGGGSAIQALSGGYQLAFVVAAASVGVALLVAALRVRRPGEREPARVRAEAEPA